MPFAIRPFRRSPFQYSLTYNTGPFQGRWTYARLKTGMEALQGEALGFIL